MLANTTQSGIQKKPKLRFPGFSNKWAKSELDKVITRFIVPMRDKPKDLSGTIPWCRIEDLDGKYLSKSKSGQGVNKDTVKAMNLKIYPVGTLLVSCSANLGVCAITKNELTTNQTFIGLVPQKDKIDVEFLFYVMGMLSFDLNTLSSGTTISYLSRQEFEKFKIPYTSLPEQQKIAEFLGMVDEWVENLRKQKESLEFYKKGIMQKIFAQEIRFKDNKGNDLSGWEEKKLGELIEELHKTNRQSSEGRTVGIYPFFDNSTKPRTRYLDEYDYDADAIISNTGGVAYFDYYNGKFATMADCFVFRAKIHTLFLYHYLKYIEKYVDYVSFAGSGIKHLDKNYFRKLKVKYPKLKEEQQKIAGFLTSIDEMIESKRQQIIQSEEWKKGLMQQLFV